MANIRTLKRNMTNMASDIINEAYLQALVKGADSSEKSEALISEAIQLHDEYVSKLKGKQTKGEPKAVKAYYKEVQASYVKKCNDLLEGIYGKE